VNGEVGRIRKREGGNLGKFPWNTDVVIFYTFEL
jgi:hypothetical protein